MHLNENIVPAGMPLMRLLLFMALLLWGLLPASLTAQKVLLLEKSGQNKSERIMEGDELTYRMRGDDFWQVGIIDELRPDIQAMVINDRFIMLEEIDALKFQRQPFFQRMGFSMVTFGAGWAAFAAVGYATDGNPETSFSGFDASVSLVSIATGFLVMKALRTKKFKPNKRRRLRVVDLTF